MFFRVNVVSRVLALVLCLFLGLLLSGCGGLSSYFSGSGSGSSSGSGGSGGSGGGGGGGGTGGTTLTNKQVVDTLNSINAGYSSIMSTVSGEAAQNAALVTMLKAQPNIATAGISSHDTVYGVFTNGNRLIVGTKYALPPVAKSVTSVVPASTVQLLRNHPVRTISKMSGIGHGAAVTRSTATNLLPQPKTARIMSGVGNLFPDETDNLNRLFTFAGYQCNVQSATVENLRSINGDGFFLLNTHGSYSVDAQGNSDWSVWSSSVVTESAMALYSADIADGSLIFWVANNQLGADGHAIAENHFAINAKFISKYQWSFPVGAVAFMNCCWGAAPAGALLNISNPAAAVFGWTLPVRSDYAEYGAYRVVDCMLGTNLISPIASTPARPFNAAQAFDYLSQKGLIFGDATGACKMDEAGDSGLMPSIQHMEVTERLQESPSRGATKLTLYGWFGTNQGTVSVGGTEVPVTSWAPDKIECTPADVPGSGYSGMVLVKTDVTESNGRELTQWHGKLTYNIDLFPPIAASGASKIDFDLYFRGDPGEYRDTRYPPASFHPMPFRASQGSTCKWTVTGSPPPTTVFLNPTSATLPYGLNAAVNAPYGTGFLFGGTLDAGAETCQMGVMWLGCVTGYASTLGGPSQALATIMDSKLTSTQTGIDTTNGSAKITTPLATTMAQETFVISAKNYTGLTTTLEAMLKADDLIPSNTPIFAKGEDQAH